MFWLKSLQPFEAAFTSTNLPTRSGSAVTLLLLLFTPGTVPELLLGGRGAVLPASAPPRQANAPDAVWGKGGRGDGG